MHSYDLTVTYYCKTIVHGAQNVYLVPMAMITGYKGGMNIVPFNQQSFMERARTRRAGTASVVCLMEPYSTVKLDALINLTGAHAYAQFGLQDNPVKNSAKHYVNSDWAAAYVARVGPWIFLLTRPPGTGEPATSTRSRAATRVPPSAAATRPPTG